MLPRFFVPEAGRSAAESIALPEDEARHAARVMRLAAGHAVRVFNGTGAEWHAQVTEVARGRVRVALREPVAPAREPEIGIVLALAVLKGDKMDDVVRDAVMMGATAIQPLLTERTEISAAAAGRSNRVERWQRVAVASCKQCGRAVVPPIAPPRTFDAWMAEPTAALRLMLVEPNAGAVVEALHGVARPASAELVVGPEGGWAERELREAAHAGARLVTLGALTLRADAAPLVALTAIRTLWRDL